MNDKHNSYAVTLAENEEDKDRNGKDSHIDNIAQEQEIQDELERLKDDITQATNDYINRLHNADDIYKPNVFNGLVIYIYSTCICGAHNNYTPIDRDNIPLLYTLWNYYISICSQYDKTCTVIQYSTLLGVHNTLLYQWARGNTRKASKRHNVFAKMVLQSCESATLGRTIDQNSIGAMFALKSIFGYEDSTKQVLEVRNTSEQSTSEITAKYSALLDERDGDILGAQELSRNSTAKTLGLNECNN